MFLFFEHYLEEVTVDCIAGEAIFDAESFGDAIVNPIQASTVGRDPERAVAVEQHDRDREFAPVERRDLEGRPSAIDESTEAEVATGVADADPRPIDREAPRPN